MSATPQSRGKTPHRQGRISFYATPEHPCSYLQDRPATTVFLDPALPKTRAVHTLLSQNGFRRSGSHIYRPSCKGCDSCVAVRIPAAAFTPGRSQKRCWRTNRDLTVIPREGGFDEEHFALYERYIHRRHFGGGMENPTGKQYMGFLNCPWSQTRFVEFRLGTALLAVAVMDELLDGFSAVYTFFDPDHAGRGLGVFAILWQIQETRRQGLDWLYLGYWVRQSRKMKYKAGFLPQQRLMDGRWQLIERP